MNFNSPQFNTVVEKALVLAADSPKWRKAIERAASGLRDGSIVVSELASGAVVTTENGTYKVGHNCECAASAHNHRECKHRAARRLCTLYSEAEVSELCERNRIEREVETRVIEYDRTGASYTVVRCGGWPI